MGKEVLVDLSHPFGDKCPLWPYFADVKIERMHYMAKSGVLSQVVTTTMHCTTHADSPAHVVEGLAFTHEIPLSCYYGDAVIWDIPKEKWELITAKDLDAANKKLPMKEHDIIIIHTGWNRYPQPECCSQAETGPLCVPETHRVFHGSSLSRASSRISGHDHLP